MYTSNQVNRTASQKHLLTTTGTDPEGVSARCGGDPPGPLPQPDKNPLRARIRRGLERSGLFQPMELQVTASALSHPGSLLPFFRMLDGDGQYTGGHGNTAKGKAAGIPGGAEGR